MHIITKELPSELRHAEKLASLMDDRFRVPIIGYRFGLDPIIGLIPGAGDVVSAVISLLIVRAIIRSGFPRKLMLQLLFPVLLDLVIGGIPVIGDAWDFFFKANRRNLKIAKRYFEEHA